MSEISLVASTTTLGDSREPPQYPPHFAPVTGPRQAAVIRVTRLASATALVAVAGLLATGLSTPELKPVAATTSNQSAAGSMRWART